VFEHGAQAGTVASEARAEGGGMSNESPCHLPRWFDANGNCEHPDHDFRSFVVSAVDVFGFTQARVYVEFETPPIVYAELAAAQDALRQLRECNWQVWDQQNPTEQAWFSFEEIEGSVT
jgi:hypothetical protein